MSEHTINYGKLFNTQTPAELTFDLDKGGMTIIIAKEGQGYSAIERVIASSLARDNEDKGYLYFIPESLLDFAETIGSHNFTPMIVDYLEDFQLFPGDTNVMFASVGGKDSSYNTQDIDHFIRIATTESTHVFLTLTPETFIKRDFAGLNDAIASVVVASNDFTEEITEQLISKLNTMRISYTAPIYPETGEIYVHTPEQGILVKMAVPPFVMEG